MSKFSALDFLHLSYSLYFSNSLCYAITFTFSWHINIYIPTKKASNFTSCCISHSGPLEEGLSWELSPPHLSEFLTSAIIVTTQIISTHSQMAPEMPHCPWMRNIGL